MSSLLNLYSINQSFNLFKSLVTQDTHPFLTNTSLPKCGHRKQYYNTFKFIFICVMDDEVRCIGVIDVKVGLSISWILGERQHFLLSISDLKSATSFGFLLENYTGRIFRIFCNTFKRSHLASSCVLKKEQFFSCLVTVSAFEIKFGLNGVRRT